MGSAREGVLESETKAASRSARWAEERSELLISENKRGEQQVGPFSPLESHQFYHQQQSRRSSRDGSSGIAAHTHISGMEVDPLNQAGIASHLEIHHHHQQHPRGPSRDGSKPSRIGALSSSSTSIAASIHLSGMEPDSQGFQQEFRDRNDWNDNASPSRDLTVYSSKDMVGGMSQDAPGGRRRSPRLAPVRSSGQSNLEEDLAPERFSGKKPKSPRKAKSKHQALPSEEAVKFSHARLRPRQTPRRTRVDEDELQEVLAEIIQDQSLTLARVARRQSKASRSRGSKDVQDPTNEPESGLREFVAPASTGDSQEETLLKGAGGRRAKARRQKRKAVDAGQDIAFSDDHPASEERRAFAAAPAPGFHPLQGLQQIVSRATTRKEPNSTSSSWMQLFGDLIMWRDVPRSTLLFGAGCFCILSASFIQDVHCGALTFTAYMALVYLAAVFLHRNFLLRGASEHMVQNWELAESEAFEMLRVILPAINLVLRKCGQLFCGDPSTTLKVASILWLLAQAGYFMTIWSFARFAFLLMFIIPKLYFCYSHQIHGHAEAWVERLWKAWSAYSHKKAAIFGAMVLTWNMSSATSRLYGAFLLLVTIKLYTRHLADQPSEEQMDTDELFPVSEQVLESPSAPPIDLYSLSQKRLSCKKD